ncbi:hypothetical protein KUV89_03905 [Marinobacter hydrocarbonoclasticus]|nr:hypothetical protein [Marinobacter nauticus]
MFPTLRSLLPAGLILLMVGCGGSDSASPEPEVQPLPHPGLEVQASSLQFQPSRHALPALEGALGRLTFSLTEDSPTDVVDVDGRTGEITVNNVGAVTVLVKDDGGDRYLPTQTQWRVTVTPGARSQLVANDLVLSSDAQPTSLSVFGAIGTLHYSPLDEVPVVSVSDDGKVTPLRIGANLVHIADDGGRNYQGSDVAVLVKVVAAEGQSAHFSDVSPKPFLPGSVLYPVMQGELAVTHHYQLSDDSADDVVRLNPDSGAMEVIGAGIVSVEVVQSNGDGYAPVPTERFTVTVLPSDNIHLQVNDLRVPFAFDGEVPLPVNGVQGELSVELAADAPQNVVAVTEANELALLGPGKVTLRITDDGGRNYLPLTQTLQVEVDPLPHPGLNVLDRQQAYEADTRWPTLVQGAQGELTFALAAGSETDVARVDPYDGTLTPLRPGTARIEVRDDGGRYYQSTQTQFTVTITQAAHPGLTVEPLSAVYQAGVTLTPIVDGQVGELSLKVVDGHDVVAVSGPALAIMGAGVATAEVQDGGDAFTASTTARLTVSIHQADSGLTVSNLTATFLENGTVLLPVSGATGIPSFALSHGADKDVVSVNASTGELTLLNAGHTSVTVTDPGDANTRSDSKQVNITVEQGPANPHLAVSDAALSGIYGQQPVAAPEVTGREADSWVSYWIEDQGQRLIADIDSTTGLVTAKQAGLVEVTVTEHSRNYLDTQVHYQVAFEKGRHPGLLLPSQPDWYQAFYPDIRIPAPITINAVGKLSYHLIKGENVALNDDGSLIVHRKPLSEESIQMLVTDDGGNKVTPDQASLRLYLDDTARNAGEREVLTFTGEPLEWDVAVPVMPGGTSQLDAQSDHDRGLSKTEGQNGYTLLMVQVQLEETKQTVPITVRLSTRNGCNADAPWVALDTPFKQSCSDPMQPVRLTLSPEDGFNADLLAGHYRSVAPIIVTQRAQDWQPGGVVADGPVIARAWWLVDIDFTR